MHSSHKKCNSKLLIAFIVLFIIISISSFATNARFIVFHTSDIHGHIEARPIQNSTATPKPLVGGFAILKNCIDQVKKLPENKNTRLLYFDSGDLFQGTPVVNRTKGKVMIDLMNAVGLSATTIGNHDFDYSYENLIAQFHKANFPIICCNVFDRKTGRIPKIITPYKIFTFNGKRLGLIGIDTPNTPSMSIAKNVKNVIFKNPVPILKKIIKKMKLAKVDFILLLSHLGFDQDLLLAEKVRDINLILGGHSHTYKSRITYAGPDNTAIIHSGAYLAHTSEITIELNDNMPPSIELNSIELLKSKYGENPKIKRIEESYLNEIKKEMDKVIGHNKVTLHRGVCGGDSNLGSIISDAMREASNSDFAFINFGGIRESMYKGDVTVGDIFKIQPFDNTIDVLTMKGKDLINLVELSLSNPFTEMQPDDKSFALDHFQLKAEGLMRVVGPKCGYLYPSNLIVKFDPKKPAMERIISITDSKGNKIIPYKEYTVAFNDFMANGGDGYQILKSYPKKQTYVLVRDALMKKVISTNGIQEKPEVRMINPYLKQEYQDQ